MLIADFVVQHRQELIEQVELHAAAEEEPGAARGRHARIAALVSELIEDLQGGSRSPPPRAGAPGRDGALLFHERDLVRQEIVADVAQRLVPVSPNEMVVVSDWTTTSDRRRLEERARCLADLLDGVHEKAAIVTPDGRI